MSDQRTLKFRAETRRVLDLVINSLYSNSDIFLRELVSNASDAIDRLRYLALDDPDLTGDDFSPRITITLDEKDRTITVTDNGIGMNDLDLESNLGTVASSGTLKFLEEAASNSLKPELIGQFGVGFYSAFMVADSVDVKTRKAGEKTSWLWQSSGGEDYSISKTEEMPPGTSVVLHIKEESGDYLQKWKIESLVRHYSDFVSNPVFLQVAGEDSKEGPEQINTGTPVWLRNPSDVEDSEYEAFYSHLTHDHEKPLDRFWYHGEGVTEFHALVFIPSSRGMDILIPDRRPGLSLYARKVMIMEKAGILLPEYLHFLRGVVESPDIALNVSREMLQQDRVLRTISRVLTRKLIDHLAAMMEDDEEKYRAFFRQFGDFLKEGVYTDHERSEELAGLLLFHNSSSELPESLASVCEEVPEDGAVHYIAGASLEELRRSPHLESAGSSKVLLLHGPMDILAMEALGTFRKRKLVNLASEAAEKGLSQEEKDARAEAEKEHSKLIKAFRKTLADSVSGVRFSPRLRETPCILVSGKDDPGEMMKMMMKAMNQDTPEVKKILELNPSHPLIGSLERFRKDSSQEDFENRLRMVLELARVLSGSRPSDPVEFGRYIAELMTV